MSGGPPGSRAASTQVRECADQLIGLAKSRQVATVLVGHVTKDGSLAGPRALEHMVDTVLSFEGDRHHALRLLLAVKHRFGPTGELGLFEMGDQGLNRVDDPGRLLLGDRLTGVPGGVVLPAVQGRRTLVVELQALVTPMGQAQPKRSVVGLDGGRLVMTLAVLAEHAGLAVLKLDVFASVAGGIRVTEPAADLAVALAVASAATGRGPARQPGRGRRGRPGRRGPPGHQPAPAARGVGPAGLRPGGRAGVVPGRASRHRADQGGHGGRGGLARSAAGSPSDGGDRRRSGDHGRPPDRTAGPPPGPVRADRYHSLCDRPTELAAQ